METVTIKAGVTGFDVGSRKRVAPKYRFNSTVTVPVVGRETRGCDEHARACLLVAANGKTLSVLVADVATGPTYRTGEAPAVGDRIKTYILLTRSWSYGEVTAVGLPEGEEAGPYAPDVTVRFDSTVHQHHWAGVSHLVSRKA